MNIGTPHIILIVLWTMSWMVSLVRHGKPKKDNYNVISASIGIAMQVWLLWWGGFFS